MDIDLYHTCNQNKYMNPDYEYIFFDKDARLSFIKQYFPQYLEDYNSILPGAYKADLFRYLALYQLGGVYIDCKSCGVEPLSEFISPTDQVVLVRDLNDDYIYNGLIASIPGSIVMKTFIDTYVQNIRKKYYGKNVFDIGGPSMCGTVFKSLIQRPEPIQLGEYLIGSEKVTVSSYVDFTSVSSVIRRADKKVLLNRVSNRYLFSKLKNILLVKDYSSMWFFRKVYKP
jgi:mannosyltransferase OCH1-like enzyme